MSIQHRGTPKLPWRHIYNPTTGAAAARRKRNKAPRVTLSSVDDRTVVAAPSINTLGVESLFNPNRSEAIR